METNTSPELERAARLLENIEQDLRALKQILGVSGGSFAQISSSYIPGAEDPGIEGTFDGERMIDADGKTYQVSANYASKSKLVEGDPLKLYISPEGKFFYKQLGPIERKTVPGTLTVDGTHYSIEAEDGNTYSVLTASVTYYMSLYNLRAGDRVMALLPADRPARWAVIDNVL